MSKIKEMSVSLVQAELTALNQVLEVVQSPQYHALVEWLEAALVTGRLVITGVGKNAHIAAKISETMASLGLPSYYLNTSHAVHGDLGFLRAGDVVIHISRSGTTKEMLDLMGYVHAIMPELKQVLIHCNPSLPTNHDADWVLCLGKVIEGDEHKLAPTASTTALLCVLDAISTALSAKREFARYDFLKLHPAGALGEMLRKEKQSEQA